jgi:hypothetical protein
MIRIHQSSDNIEADWRLPIIHYYSNTELYRNVKKKKLSRGGRQSLRLYAKIERPLTQVEKTPKPLPHRHTASRIHMRGPDQSHDGDRPLELTLSKGWSIDTAGSSLLHGSHIRTMAARVNPPAPLTPHPHPSVRSRLCNAKIYGQIFR